MFVWPAFDFRVISYISQRIVGSIAQVGLVVGSVDSVSAVVVRV